MKLVLKKVTKKFKGKTVINEIDLKLSEGVYGLLGPNGAGKTTIFRCITGLYEVNSGVIGFIDTVDGIVDLKSEDIGYLPQKFGVFKNMKVKDFMEYFAVLKNVPKDEIREQVENCLKAVNLEEKINDKVKTLSGGMVRRLGIAQTLLGNPKLILLDEPTTGLDPEERIRFKKIISGISKDKIVIISTHIVEDIDAVCSKVIIMNSGRILACKSKEEMIGSVKSNVYEVEESQLATIEEPYFVIRLNSQGNQVYNRLITKAELPFGKVIPSLEDAYHEFISE